jgi:hypothetical protein
LDRAERLAAGVAQPALATARRAIEARHKAVAPRVEALYTALAGSSMPAILAAAEAVLETVPEHPAARQARTRAWQQIAAIGPSATWPNLGARTPQSPQPHIPLASESVPAPRERPRDAAPFAWMGAVAKRPGPAGPAARPLARAVDGGPSGRFLLWLDAVGGYLVCMDDQIILGRAGADSNADVPVMGDLSRHHATLVRDGDGYVLRASQPTFINGQAVESVAPVHDGDVIRLGSTVELEFRQPSPVSATARLAIVSRHRLPLAVDGVLLMAETCIIGSSPQAHIPAPGLDDPIVLYRQGAALWCRAAGGFEVDGRACAARAPLTLQSSVLGDGFSFSLEPLGSKTV